MQSTGGCKQNSSKQRARGASGCSKKKNKNKEKTRTIPTLSCSLADLWCTNKNPHPCQHQQLGAREGLQKEQHPPGREKRKRGPLASMHDSSFAVSLLRFFLYLLRVPFLYFILNNSTPSITEGDWDASANVPLCKMGSFL